jgi:tetratricopeptide (TPR) repeat protein
MTSNTVPAGIVGARNSKFTMPVPFAAVAPAFPLAHLWLGRAYQEQGRLDDAALEFVETRRILGDWPIAIAALGHVLGLSGRASEARRVLDELDQLSRRQYVTEYGVALVHAGLGDRDAAFDWLERAVAARSHWLVWLELDPRWQVLKGDPRFAAVVGLAQVEGAPRESTAESSAG